MTDAAERTETMNAYAQTYGGPDSATTTRMRQRLRSRGVEIEVEGRRIRRGVVVATLALVVVAAVAARWWLADPATGSAVVADDRGIVATDDVAQRLGLSAGGSIALEPRSRLRLAEDAPGRTTAELLEGTMRFTPASSTHSLDLRIGPYRVEAPGATFEARRTRGVPLIVVTGGRVRLRGPDLPPEGLRIAPDR